MKKGIIILVVLLLFCIVGVAVTVVLINTNSNDTIDTTVYTGKMEKTRVVTYNYNSKKISMEIPEKWEYETNVNGDTSLNYIIKIYPNKEDKEKYIVFNTDKFFGVCGTGLEVKKVELNNGKTVEFGYYYNESKTWSYVVLEEDEQYLYAWNINLSKEEGETAIQMIKTLQFN